MDPPIGVSDAVEDVGRSRRGGDLLAAKRQADSPARSLRKSLSVSRPSLDYQRVTRDFYAISGVTGGTIYYSRCNVSRASGTLHCFDLKYPVQEKAVWDGIVTRMSRSLRPLNRS